MGGPAVGAGQAVPAHTEVADCGLDNVTYDSSTKILLMGKPLTFTKENVGDYNF